MVKVSMVPSERSLRTVVFRSTLKGVAPNSLTSPTERRALSVGLFVPSSGSPTWPVPVIVPLMLNWVSASRSMVRSCGVGNVAPGSRRSAVPSPSKSNAMVQSSLSPDAEPVVLATSFLSRLSIVMMPDKPKVSVPAFVVTETFPIFIAV